MTTMLNLLGAIVIIACVLISSVAPIWRCKGKTEKPFRRNEIFHQSCQLWILNAVNYLKFKDNGDHTYTLDSAQYGIDGIENTTNFGPDIIRAYIRDNYGLETKDMDYLGPLKSETKVVDVDPFDIGRVLIFQLIFDCFVSRRSDSIGNSKDFKVYTGPLRLTFPPVGNCTPTDQYVTHRLSKGIENHLNTKRNTTITPEALLVYGIGWNFRNTFQIPLNMDSTVEFRALNRAEFHEEPPVYRNILDELALKFASLNPSTVTNVHWEKNFTTSLHILSNGNLADFDRTFERNSKTTFYKLVGICESYLVVTKKIYKRVSDITSGKCIEFDGAREGIEKCDFCQKLECADRKDFPKVLDEDHQDLVDG